MWGRIERFFRLFYFTFFHLKSRHRRIIRQIKIIKYLRVAEPNKKKFSRLTSGWRCQFPVPKESKNPFDFPSSNSFRAISFWAWYAISVCARTKKKKIACKDGCNRRSVMVNKLSHPSFILIRAYLIRTLTMTSPKF